MNGANDIAVIAAVIALLGSVIAAVFQYTTHDKEKHDMASVPPAIPRLRLRQAQPVVKCRYCGRYYAGSTNGSCAGCGAPIKEQTNG